MLVIALIERVNNGMVLTRCNMVDFEDLEDDYYDEEREEEAF